MERYALITVIVLLLNLISVLYIFGNSTTQKDKGRMHKDLTWKREGYSYPIKLHILYKLLDSLYTEET